MEGASLTRHERMLICEPSSEHSQEVLTALSTYFVGADFEIIDNSSQVFAALDCRLFNVVILSEPTPEIVISILHRLKLYDHAPIVVVLVAEVAVGSLSRFYDAGAPKCIVKRGPWVEELGPAIRQLVRLKRLEDENTALLSKLTEANQLLEERNRRLDEFSSTLAHDIRGPLGGISMKLDFLADQLKPGHDPRIVEMISRAYGSCERLIGVVQAMYEYARLGAQGAKMAEVDLGDLIENVVADCGINPALDVRIGIGALPKVWGSEALLRRVFINLLQNAVKYNDKPQCIINVGMLGLEERSISAFAKIYVEDNGKGIPADELRWIFSMFTRGHNASSNGDGVGIGLAVVQKIAELHYGKVEVESVLGKSTRFIITLPLEPIDFISRPAGQHKEQESASNGEQ